MDRFGRERRYDGVVWSLIVEIDLKINEETDHVIMIDWL